MPDTLYISRNVQNAQDVLNWAKEAGIKESDLVPADKMHVTVCYSKTAVDWYTIPSADATIEVNSNFHLELLGDDKNILVLRFSSADLTARHEELMALGASHDYDSYKPHVTISYEPVSTDKVLDIAPYSGKLIFGPEVFDEIDENFVDKLKAAKSVETELIPRSIPLVSGNSKITNSNGLSIGPTQMKVNPNMSTNRALNMLAEKIADAVKKSVPDGLLGDLEQIPDIYDRDGKNRVPSANELGTSGETQHMHGAEAAEQAEKHGVKTPQMGITKDYQELAGRLGRVEKALRGLVPFVKSMEDAVKKSDDDDKKDDEDDADKAEKAVRKARVAVRKADDEDDDDDKKDAWEKADRAITAAKAAIEKAEDADKDEERTEKARKDLRAVKSALKTARDTHEAAKKAAEAPVAAKTEGAAAEACPMPAAPATPAGEQAPAAKSDPTQIEVLTKNVADLMELVRGNGTFVPAPVVKAPLAQAPVLQKAATPELLTQIAERINDADDASPEVIIKATGMYSLLSQVQEGKMNRADFDAELAQMPVDVKRLFEVA